MSSESYRTKAVRESAQIVAKQMIQEPVKEAVREAIREEAVAVDERERERAVSQQSQSERSQSDSDGGGRSRLFWGGILAAIVGVTVLARRRMRSQSESWSGPSTDIATDESQGGYSTEGEMQTSEGAGESDEVSHSTSTTSDQ